MLKPKVVLLIFVSGKIVLTGAKVQFKYLILFVCVSWLGPLLTQSFRHIG